MTRALDGEPPSWNVGDALAVTARTPTRITLAWPEATDNVGVAGYRVSRGSLLVATLPPTARTWTDIALGPSTALSYTVRAFDLDQNEASLSASTSTQPPSAPPAWTSATPSMTVVQVGKRGVSLSWTPATDDYNEVAYAIDVRTGSASTPLFTWTVNTQDIVAGTPYRSPAVLTPGTAYEFSLRVHDFEGQSPSVAGPTVSATTRALTDPPLWPMGASLLATAIGGGSVRVQAPDVLDAAFYQCEVRSGGAWSDCGQSPTRIWQVGPLAPGRTWEFRVTHRDTEGVDSAPLTAEVTLPDFAFPTAPPVDRTQVGDLWAETSFLFEGPAASQYGLQPGVLDRRRLSVVHGRVIARDGGAPVANARVAVLYGEQFGVTYTDAQGRYALATNGGSEVVLEIRKGGMLTAQRRVETRWNEHATASDVALVAEAATSTEVNFGSAWQFAEGPSETDTDGTRRAVVAIPPGTTATAVPMEQGVSPTVLTSAHLRVREFTVGDNGAAAMPGTIPPQVDYNWCADFSFDEAPSSEYARVEFNHPVPVYVDNFVGFTVGAPVPSGYYDEREGAWAANELGNGIVMQVLSAADADGGAQLDLTNDGVWDAADEAVATAQGITLGERVGLRARYPSGANLWRFQVMHFTAWDANWGLWPPADAVPWPVRAISSSRTDEHINYCPGSVIDCQNRSLGEEIPLEASGASLVHWSDRTRAASRRIEIPYGIGSAPLPSSLIGVVIEIYVDGARRERVLLTTPTLYEHRALRTARAGIPFVPIAQGDFVVGRYNWTWDGTDVFGRVTQGAHRVKARVGYVYPTQPARVEGFGYNGNGLEITDLGGSRAVVVLWNSSEASVGGWDQAAQGLGGWSFGFHHAYDPRSGTVTLGAGGRRSGAALAQVGARIAAENTGSPAEGVPLALASIGARALEVSPEGHLWFAEDCRIRRVTGDGTVVTVVGDRYLCGCGPDGPVETSFINAPGGLALVGGDALMFSEPSCHRVRMIVDGNIFTVAGTGGSVQSGSPDHGDALEVPLGHPMGISWSEEGRFLLIADLQGNRVLRLDASTRRIRTVAGNPYGSMVADNIDALARAFYQPSGITVLRGGGFAFTDQGTHQIFRVGVNGRVRLLAGNMYPGFSNDGGEASAAQLNTPTVIREMPDGSLLFADSGNARVRFISVNGQIDTVLGTGQTTLGPWGLPPRRTNLSTEVLGLAPAPDGGFYFADYTHRHVGRIVPVLPGFGHGETFIPNESGSELYGFDAMTGCHRRTIDAVTGAQRYRFEYEGSSCRLQRVILGADAENNRITLVRNGTTEVRIRGPHYGGGNTEEDVLTLDGAGNLDRVVHADQTWEVTHTADGLLTDLWDPLNRHHHFEYDAHNLLRRDQNAAGTVTQLFHPTAPTQWSTLVARVVGEPDATDPAVTHRFGADRHFVTQTPAGVGGSPVTTDIHDPGNGTIVTEQRSGANLLSRETVQQSPDPRLGMAVPMTTRRTVTVGARSVTTERARAFGLRPGSSLLGWQTDTLSVPGEGSARVTERYDWSHADCGGQARILTTTRGGRSVRVCLNAAGRVARTELLGAVPAVHPVVYGYDGRGRVSTVTQGERRTRTTYRGDGRVASTALEALVDGAWVEQASTSTTWDPLTLRPTARTLPDGTSVGLSVDAAQQLVAVTPASRAAHTLGYDGAGRMNAFTSPTPGSGQSALSLAWRYDVRGRLDRVTRADSTTVDMGFDAATNALTDVTFPGLGVLHRERRPMTGATDWVSAPNGCRERVLYESSGELLPRGVVLESVPGAACAVTGSVSATRNALGETTAMTVGDTPAVTFTVDADADRLLTNAGGMAITPDAATGRLTGTSVGVVATTQTYSAYGVPASIVATANGVTEAGFVYTTDARGRIASIAETGQRTRTTSFVYDAAGRLWQVWRGGVEIARYEHAGSDGANGNRTSWTTDGVSHTASYDGQDRLTSYTEGSAATTLGYDAHGNVQTRTTGGDVTTYTWDPRGPLARVQRPGGAADIAYVLDPAGRRIGRTVGGALERGWLYAGGLLPVAETDADGSTVRRVFVYATRPNVPDLVRQLEGGTWVTYRVIADHLGSVRAVLRASDGAVVQRMDYDAFGRVVADEVASGWVPVPFGFAGGLYDRETGLVRFGAREYDARIGRWVSRDPALFGGGDTNLYRYCGGEPVNSIDPDGREPLDAIQMSSLSEGVSSLWRTPTTGLAVLLAMTDYVISTYVAEWERHHGERPSYPAVLFDDATDNFGDPTLVMSVVNSRLMSCGALARTVGNVASYAPGQYSSSRDHEAHHVAQHGALGPYYIPAQLAAISYSYARSAAEPLAGDQRLLPYARFNPFEQAAYSGRNW